MKRPIPRLSVGIAGAGPVGLSAALFLARDGHRVTLVERFEAPHAAGSATIAGIVIDPRKTLRLGKKPRALAGAPLAADQI